MRNLRSAFFASGRRARFAAISKEKMLHLLPSSWTLSVWLTRSILPAHLAYSSHTVVQRPDGLIKINALTKRVRERWAFGDRRDGRFQEVHRLPKD